MSYKTKEYAHIWQLFFLTLTIFLFRITYVYLYQNLQDIYGFSLSNFIAKIIQDYPSIITIALLCFGFEYLISKKIEYGKHPLIRVSIIFFGIIAISAITTIVCSRDILGGNLPVKITYSILAITFLAAIITIGIIILVIDLIIYNRKSKKQLIQETNQKRKAEYQYYQLKGQLNPHFLFNCLNILDYLVQNQETERASDFIKKLAGTYRYLLNKESHKLVTIQEEINFVQMYISLLKERFTTGLNVEINIPDILLKDPSKKIVPSGLQLLVENATKHNIVNTQQPLTIKIYTTKDYIIVTNNLQLKIIDSSTSNKIGLTNIKAQYKDIAKKEVIIEQTKEEFKVSLPIISSPEE